MNGQRRASEHSSDGHIQGTGAEEQKAEEAAGPKPIQGLEIHLLPWRHDEVNGLPHERIADAQRVGTRRELGGNGIAPEKGREAGAVNRDDQLARLVVLLRRAGDRDGRGERLLQFGEVENGVLGPYRHESLEVLAF